MKSSLVHFASQLFGYSSLVVGEVLHQSPCRILSSGLLQGSQVVHEGGLKQTDVLGSKPARELCKQLAAEIQPRLKCHFFPLTIHLYMMTVHAESSMQMPHNLGTLFSGGKTRGFIRTGR
ncbi:hypothetical protein [Bradyrhizobium sp. 76]|uniref:hypothetical protein n=1 Tax=Bradyrhizobium sp. 76 TaxID=2782680 RepID=UPI001FFA34CB|nr:hypothetical protein [Bradyrhizobium sp. 76]